MKDLTSRTDIILLVDRFYEQVLVDEVIGHFFTEVVPIQIETHMPVMYDFWESTLFGTGVYKGNPMLKHLSMNALSPLQAVHFERWLKLWATTIHTHFSGEKADLALQRAKQIALLMQHKITQQSRPKNS